VKANNIASDTTSTNLDHNCETSATPMRPSRGATTVATLRGTPSWADCEIQPRQSVNFCVAEKMSTAPMNAAHHSVRLHISEVWVGRHP
jgi:hypothetical protein